MVVDKPHNNYLLLWSSFGLLGLFLFISIVIMTIRPRLVCFREGGKCNGDRMVHQGMIVSIMIFMLGSLAYDSMVVTSLYLWVILGLLACESGKSLGNIN